MNLHPKNNRFRCFVASLTLCLLAATLRWTPVAGQELLPPATSSADPAFTQQPAFSREPESAPLPDEPLGEAMLRGPVHEAFAEQVSPNPEPGLIVDRTPPEPIEELPPEVRPDGERVEWISGYWAWDDDREDFIWISGLWRNMPPRVRWLPGYWAEVEQGFQWVPGSWIPSQEPELEYIADAPPETLELGPVGDAPSIQHFWVPGHWSWLDTRYVWSPGFWSISQTNWVWVPTRYLYTPRGYVHCQGYWDYPLTSRGSLFAPYWFSQPYALQPNYFFRPRVLIALNVLPWHFWVRPGYSHYYFGDYYATSYRQRGILPWHNYYRQSRGIDPLFNYYDRNQRGDISFYQQINQQFNLSVNQSDRRPPRSFQDQVDRGLVFQEDDLPLRSRPSWDELRNDRDQDRFLTLGQTVGEVSQNSAADVGKLSQKELARIRERSVELREVQRSRREAESVRAELPGLAEQTDRVPGRADSDQQLPDRENDMADGEAALGERSETNQPQSAEEDRELDDAVVGNGRRDRTIGRDANNANQRNANQREAGLRDQKSDPVQPTNRWRLPTMRSGENRDRTNTNTNTTKTDGDPARPSTSLRSRADADAADAIADPPQRSVKPDDRRRSEAIQPSIGNDSRLKNSRAATEDSIRDSKAMQDTRQRNQPVDPRKLVLPRPDNANRIEPSDRERPEVNRPEVNRPEVNRPEVNRPEVNRPESTRPEPNRLNADRPRSLRIESRLPANDAVGNRSSGSAGQGTATGNFSGDRDRDRGRDRQTANEQSFSPLGRSLTLPAQSPQRSVDRTPLSSPAARPAQRSERPQSSPVDQAIRSSRDTGTGARQSPEPSSDRGRPSLLPGLAPLSSSPPAVRQPSAVREQPPARQPSSPPASIRQQESPRPQVDRPQAARPQVDRPQAARPQSVPSPAARQSNNRSAPSIRPSVSQPSPRVMERPRGGGGENNGSRRGGNRSKRDD